MSFQNSGKCVALPTSTYYQRNWRFCFYVTRWQWSVPALARLTFYENLLIGPQERVSVVRIRDLSHNSNTICKWVTIVEISTKYVNDLFEARVSCFLCLIVEEVKIKPWWGFKRYFKQKEKCTSFLQTLQDADIFPIFPLTFFLKTQRHLYVVIIFKTEGSKEFNFWKGFYFALSTKYLLQRHATYVCFHISISVIIHHQTLTGWKFYYEERKHQGILCSTPKESSIKWITRIVSQNL